MRDEQGGAALRERAQRLVDGGFGGGVDRGRGVVEHQHPRVGEHRPGQRDPLPLPAREREPALADERVVALGEALDERVHLRGPRRGQHLGLRRVGTAVGDVGPDGVGEQERLLEHHAQLAAQVDEPQRRQRHPAEAQLALLRVVEARQQQPDRGLARPRRPDQRERLPRRDGEIDPVEHRLAARVAERDAVELHAQRALGQRGRVLRIDDVGLRVDQVVHPLHARPRELARHDEHAEHPGGPDEPRDVGGEREERAEGDRPVEREPPADADDQHLAERGQGRERGVEPRGHPRGAQPLAEEPPGARLQGGDLARLLPEPLDDPDAGDRLLHVLGDVGGLLLRRPGGREQRAAAAHRDPQRERQHDERHEREQRRQPQHGGERRHDEHAVAQRERHDRQEALQEVEVGDRAGDDLAGAQRVLPLAVEPLDGGEDLAAQVVLHVEREPTAEEPPQERRREPDDGEPEERGDDRPQRGRGSRHRLVDRRPGEQRAHGIEAHAERRRHQRGDRHPAMAHRGTDEAADPAGGGSVVHSSTLGRRADSSHVGACWRYSARSERRPGGVIARRTPPPHTGVVSAAASNAARAPPGPRAEAEFFSALLKGPR